MIQRCLVKHTIRRHNSPRKLINMLAMPAVSKCFEVNKPTKPVTSEHFSGNRLAGFPKRRRADSMRFLLETFFATSNHTVGYSLLKCVEARSFY